MQNSKFKTEIGLKSAQETQYWLCLLRDTHLVDKEQVTELLLEAQELTSMLAAGVIKLKRTLKR